MIEMKFVALNYVQFDRKAVRSAMGKGARVVAKEVRGLARKSGGSGEQYKIGGRMHRASSPGQPPAKLSGMLGGSIAGRASRRGYALVVQALAPHALLLEHGTVRAAPRRFFRPAFASQASAVQDLLVSAVGEGLTVTPGQPGTPPKAVEIN